MRRLPLGLVLVTSLALLTPTRSAQAAAAAPGTAHVHIESDARVTLEMSPETGAPWTFACDSPCDADLPLAFQYRFRGEDIRDGKPFELRAWSGDSITLFPRSKARRAGGIVLVTLGGVVALVSLVAIAVAAYIADPCQGIDPDPRCQNDYSRPPSKPVSYAPEGVGIGVGVVMVIAGVALLTSEGRARVASTSTNGEPPLPPKRAPEWRQDSGPTRMPRLTSIPVLQLRF